MEALKGVKISGSGRIQGDLLSLEKISMSGSANINGNVSATDISIGRERTIKRSVYKHNNKIYGNVLARNSVNLIGALVDGDVKGRNVVIGRGTEVTGTIYYVDTFRKHEKSLLAKNPVQITEDELHF
ncbi:MAG: hypothetical protein ACXADU_05845 [Promethearchaeota archaeon]